MACPDAGVHPDLHVVLADGAERGDPAGLVGQLRKRSGTCAAHHEKAGKVMPKRVKIDWRVPGGKKPENVVVVTRPGRFGNPFKVGDPGVPDAATAVECFEGMYGLIDGIEELRGKDLACYCPLDQPCHADVLLEWANS